MRCMCTHLVSWLCIRPPAKWAVEITTGGVSCPNWHAGNGFIKPYPVGILLQYKDTPGSTLSFFFFFSIKFKTKQSNLKKKKEEKQNFVVTEFLEQIKAASHACHGHVTY